MTSAFVIQVHPQLQSDPNEETAALLRVLIHKIDNNTFGNDTPAIPQWSGPPRTIVHVQAILYASLAFSLFSAFLAMLGKQWLNRYASIDVRGSAIERSQSRQGKLDGIVTWYFDNVMESLPLILQFALLLLGCALSLYLWGINTTVASVVLGVTSFGATFYAFIVIAGAAFMNCPYQTPGAQILRHLLSAVPPIINSSKSVGLLIDLWNGTVGLDWLLVAFIVLPVYVAIVLPISLAIDTYCLTQATVRVLVAVVRRVYGSFRDAHRWDQRTALLDVRCVTWMLQISLDKAIHLLALKLLTAMTLTDPDPVLVPACFDILTSRVAVVGGKLAVTQGSEELAAASVLCCFRTLAHLTTTDPESSILEEVRRRYTRTFPFQTNFEDSPSRHHFSMIHNLFYPSRRHTSGTQGHLYRSKIQWKGYEPGSDVLVKLARSEYQRSGCRKVPRWILRFSLHHLSQDPLPSPTIVADCLSIIAIDLGCKIPKTTILNERYVDI